MAYTQLYSGLGWGTTFEMNGKKPLIAKRSFPTLDDAYGFVNDLTPTGTACPGLIIAVTSDEITKNNGIYWIESIGVKGDDGELVPGNLVKAGGTETETADKYSDAVELSKDLVVGQLIKVTKDEVIDASGDSEDSDVEKITYKSGFYIVNSPGNISAIGTSSGADDEIGALSSRVSTLEGTVSQDVTKLENLIDEYTGTLSDIEDRLIDLEKPISEKDINDLFA